MSMRREVVVRPVTVVVAVLANMVESALAGRRWAGGHDCTGERGSEPNTGPGRGRRADEDRPRAPGPGGGGLCPPVDPGPGPRAHRVHRSAVRAGRAGGGAGLGPPRCPG